ncbi:hypothetical protein [Kordiimonas lacus]|uniref:DUF4352 domain-containing protein n=1 Tax=Kordiimonas lacus TaxID=637679 RepID=A0A1G6YR55_9PROT|nr:hypothetical protein [Kordiimonas lacus]SDD92780.1 hypothetical protein SAMN04488071_1714 [Kordiimonas lacus]
MNKKGLLFGAALALVALPVFVALSELPEPAPVTEETRDSYRAKIAIEGLFAGRGTAGEQAGMPLVWFKLRNNGQRTVTEVRVHVNFLNEHGDIVHEADFYPVHEDDYGIDRNNKPLGPGDVWQMSNIRYYMPQGVPHTWKPGAVTAHVESIRLKD